MKYIVEYSATIHNDCEIEADSDTEAAQNAQAQVEADGYIVTEFTWLAELENEQ